MSKTFYYVNGKKVSLEEYTKAEYDNAHLEASKILFNRWLKNNPQVLKEAERMETLGKDSRAYVYSAWISSDDYKSLQSTYNPDEYAKQKAGCMLVLFILLTIGCIIAIANM
jgi:hypothetical protein